MKIFRQMVSKCLLVFFFFFFYRLYQGIHTNHYFLCCQSFVFFPFASHMINWNWRTIIDIRHQYLIFNMGKACCFPPVQVFLVSPNYLHPSEARERNQITFSVVGVYTKNYTRSVQNIILSRLSKLKLRRSMDFW